MPIHIYAALLATVIAAAGLTVLVVQMFNLPFAILSLIAVATAIGLRRRLRT